MAYIGSSPTKVVSRQSANIFTYTATANQTAFTGADANGNTLACTPSDIMVHMNGIKLEESDYTASTTTVTLGSGAAAGDEVTITAFVTFETADAYTKSASDTRYVNTTGDTMTGNLGIGAAPSFSTLEVTADKTAANNLQLTLRGSTNTNKQMIMGFDTTDDQSIITSQIAGSAQKPLVVNSSAVTMPNQPSFSAYRDAGHVSGGNVYIFDHTNYNIGSMYNTSNGRATAPVSGRYFLGVWLMTNNQDSWNNKYYRIRINGANPAYRNVYSSNGGSYHHQFSWSGVIDLTASDYVDIYIDNFEAYGTNGLYSNFSMHLLS